MATEKSEGKCGKNETLASAARLLFFVGPLSNLSTTQVAPRSVSSLLSRYLQSATGDPFVAGKRKSSKQGQRPKADYDAVFSHSVIDKTITKLFVLIHQNSQDVPQEE